MKFNNTATCKVIQPSFPSCTAVQPGRVGGLHGWWPARRAALLENERNGPRRLASLISLLFLYMSSTTFFGFLRSSNQYFSGLSWPLQARCVKDRIFIY